MVTAMISSTKHHMTNLYLGNVWKIENLLS